MLDKNFEETDPRVLRLNELHRVDAEDTKRMKEIKKSRVLYKTTWGR